MVSDDCSVNRLLSSQVELTIKWSALFRLAKQFILLALSRREQDAHTTESTG
jgi:hypothetical protein